MKKLIHIGDISWCECECHTKGTPQPYCSKCYITEKRDVTSPNLYDILG